MGFLTRSRKSAPSSSSGNTPYNTSPTASSASDSTTTVDSLSARLAKTLTWGRQRSSDGNSSNSSRFPAPTSAAASPPAPKKKKQPNKVRHPSERKLTEANLRHYEILAEFRMEFGRTRSRTSFDSDVSPMGSRMGSFDYGNSLGPFAVAGGERR